MELVIFIRHTPTAASSNEIWLAQSIHLDILKVSQSFQCGEHSLQHHLLPFYLWTSAMLSLFWTRPRDPRTQAKEQPVNVTQEEPACCTELWKITATCSQLTGRLYSGDPAVTADLKCKQAKHFDGLKCDATLWPEENRRRKKRKGCNEVHHI
jgi:hypothetical protein